MDKVEQHAKPGYRRALIETTAWSLAFFAATFLLELLAKQLAASLGAGPQLRASLVITGICAGEWIIIGLLTITLHRQSSSLRALGVRMGAPWWAWLVAVAVGILAAVSDLRGVLNGHAFPLQLSLFRVYGGVVAGGTAGFCEEVFFRGYIMTRLRDAGAGLVVQILLSGFWFGVAHFGWGNNLILVIEAIAGNILLGIVFALVYLLSRRSLLPAIVGHALIDLTTEPWLVLLRL
jgi:membrane protease YdiL (CAAX protease family)